jgi:tripartite-type tricarboxylate transporter receptor subunit TctC
MGTTIKATLAFVILASTIAAVGSAAAQNYPTKPIRVIVPFPAGGTTDIVARTVTQKLAEAFKQPLVSDNRPGGGGTIGTETAVRAKPDGYTMLIVPGSYVTAVALHKLPYDPVNDVTPISTIGLTGFVVMVHPSLAVKNTKELIAYDKANPARLNYGTGGAGSITHFSTELFNQMAGTKMAHVPYKGAAPVLNDLMGGQIQLAFVTMPAALSQLKSNRLRGLAVTTAKRANALPDLPTVADAVPGYEAVSFVAVLGPKALPQDVVTRWNSEINRVLQLPDVKERMAVDSIEPDGGSPERLRDMLKRDIEKWQKVVKTANIKPEV